MALLTEYGEENRVITDGLIVTYESQLTFGTWLWISQVGGAVIARYDKAWTAIRKATKRYKYVGMDLATAQDCAEAMISKYTRTFKFSKWNALAGDFEVVSANGTQCMAKVTVRWVEGEMYDVEVDVSEYDTRMTRTYSPPSALFSAEDSRNYDGETI